MCVKISLEQQVHVQNVGIYIYRKALIKIDWLSVVECRGAVFQLYIIYDLIIWLPIKKKEMMDKAV